MARLSWSVVWVGLATLLTLPAYGRGNPILVDGSASASQQQAVRRTVARFRTVVSALPAPRQRSRSLPGAALEARQRAVRLALARARRLEGEAKFDACVKEAARVLSEATEVLSQSGQFEELRDLHLQIGACLATAGEPDGAKPHFLAAATFDERPPRIGLHREEAEREQLAARAEVLRRARGKVRIISKPPGAEVWIDGRKVRGRTPLNADVRLGDHFVTLRRFRHEPLTERILLQPSGRVELVLDVARRTTLRAQLAEPRARREVEQERRLALALWSRAEELLSVDRVAGGQLELSLWDAAAGRRLSVVRGTDQNVDRLVCRLLRERCEPPRAGVPWYVWPLAGAVLVGAGVATVAIAENERDLRFCPPRGCD